MMQIFEISLELCSPAPFVSPVLHVPLVSSGSPLGPTDLTRESLGYLVLG